VAYFELVTEYYTISGYVQEADPDPIKDVRMVLSGDRSDTTYTDDQGYYEFTNLPRGNYRVEPHKDCWSFYPPYREYKPLESDTTEQNYAGTLMVPQADFCASPRSGPAPLTVNFEDKSTGDITSWYWEFGDGETSTEQNPTHTYCPTRDPTYTVKLTVTGPCGSDTEIKTDYITVYIPPQAAFCGSPRSGSAPLTVHFQDKSTGDITSWHWDFGDGHTSSNQNPDHTYRTGGKYTVKLKVSGPGGCDTETRTDYITVYTPPQANFCASPRSGPAPLTVQFEDKSTGDITSWSWDFGDGQTSSSRNPSHTYSNSGQYTVKLTVNGPGGSDTKTKTDYITVYAPPQADFCADTTSGAVPLTVQFTDKSTGDITSWSWDFGDGQTSTEQNPVHTYAEPDTYTVSLTVSGPGGSDTETKTDYIIVYAVPQADFVAEPTEGGAPLEVQFTDLSTGVITSWSWDFGDGQTSTEQNPVHTYAEPDTYTVSLTVSGPGGSDTETKTDYIIVYAPPRAAFNSAPTKGKAPLEVKFTDLSTGVITKWKWYFGDGTTSNEQNPTHTYADPDTYTVGLTVSGPGGSDSVVKVDYIIVNANRPPIAHASTDTTWGYIPLTVKFDATGSTDPDGKIVKYNWDFGDGNTSEDSITTHTYTTDGEFKVILTVTDDNGATDSDTVFISALLTGVEIQRLSGIPDKFGLSQNYPNPFNPQTHIKYQLPVATQVEIKIFNTLGQEIATLVNAHQTPGFYIVAWDGKDSFGNQVPSGVYLYQIRAGKFVKIRKMLLLR